MFVATGKPCEWDAPELEKDCVRDQRYEGEGHGRNFLLSDAAQE